MFVNFRFGDCCVYGKVTFVNFSDDLLVIESSSFKTGGVVYEDDDNYVVEPCDFIKHFEVKRDA